MEQTPWEALKSFLRDYDHKDGNYTEVTFNYARSSSNLADSITLRNVCGDIIILVGNRGIDDLITRGIIKERARVLVEFIRNNNSIGFTSPKGVLPESKGSFLDFQMSYSENRFIIFCVISSGFDLISSEVTSIEYNREVHDVVPGDVQSREGDPNVNPDLRGVTTQGEEMKKEIKLNLEKP